MSTTELRRIRKSVREHCDAAHRRIETWKRSLHPIPAEAFEFADETMREAARLHVFNVWLERIDFMVMRSEGGDELRVALLAELIAMTSDRRRGGTLPAVLMRQYRIDAMGDLIALATGQAGPTIDAGPVKIETDHAADHDPA